jgi:hypothetical protein
VCLIFTGINPCGGHKFSFVPLVGFTGRICTPSLLKIWPYIKERSILQDRAHPAQTPRPTFVAGVEAPGPGGGLFVPRVETRRGSEVSSFRRAKNYRTDVRVASVSFPQSPCRAFPPECSGDSPCLESISQFTGSRRLRMPVYPFALGNMHLRRNAAPRGPRPALPQSGYPGPPETAKLSNPAGRPFCGASSHPLHLSATIVDSMEFWPGLRRCRNRPKPEKPARTGGRLLPAPFAAGFDGRPVQSHNTKRARAEERRPAL